MSNHVDRAGDIAAISEVIYRYSLAMDDRNWALMDSVFLPDAEIAMGDILFHGATDGIEAIRACIECCSVTHHLNGNIIVAFEKDGAAAQVRSAFRAWHRGIGEKSDTTFEAMGSYTDRFVRTDAGWRIAVRHEQSPVAIGAADLFEAAAPVWQRLTARSGISPTDNLV